MQKILGRYLELSWNKKNGHAGQTQHGVDVYGIPFGEDKYYGIQCKGKDEYTHKQFSEKEIRNEIKKAKSLIRKKNSEVVYCINPGFWSSLLIDS